MHSKVLQGWACQAGSGVKSYSCSVQTETSHIQSTYACRCVRQRASNHPTITMQNHTARITEYTPCMARSPCHNMSQLARQSPCNHVAVPVSFTSSYVLVFQGPILRLRSAAWLPIVSQKLVRIGGKPRCGALNPNRRPRECASAIVLIHP